MKALAKRSLIGAVALTLGSPAVATAKPLIEGVSDEWLLISILIGGVIMLFACIIALTYMLYKSVPILVEKQQKEKEKKQQQEQELVTA